MMIFTTFTATGAADLGNPAGSRRVPPRFSA
ncbi:hypothetical protein JOD53_002187 [Brevibacterium luteolum]|nr:hypothetical protein [Brevibacterium luteolum]